MFYSDINLSQQLVWDGEFFKLIKVTNNFLLGLLYSRQSNGARLPTKTAGVFLWVIFWKRKCFFLLSASRACSISREDFFESYYLYSQNFPPCKNLEGNTQPRSQSFSSLPPLVVERKTLVAAGHVPSYDTNFTTGVGSTNNFCRSELKRKNGPSKFSSPVVSFTQVRWNIFVYI